MRLFAALAAVAASSLVACAGVSPDDPAESSTSDVTSVTDLSALEGELGLEKDFRDAQGNWSRGDDRLKGGPCYRRTVGSASGGNWEFRRYTTGAAFFAKKGRMPGTGDSRPVACVDIDPAPGEPRETFALDGFGLDSALRYHLGALSAQAVGHAMGGQRGLLLNGGMITGRDAKAICGFRFGVWSGEGDLGRAELNAAHDDWVSCKSAGGTDDACNQRALSVCEGAADVATARETLDRPTWNGWDLEMVGPSGSSIDVQAAYLAYLFSVEVARENEAYGWGDDGAGHFKRTLEGDEGDVHWRYVEFERLHARHFVTRVPGTQDVELEEVLLNTVLSDATSVPAARLSAMVHCARRGKETHYTCRGI